MGSAHQRLLALQDTIGGKKVHFILERGSGDNPMPLLITHGWPGSFVEFLDIIEKLAHPERFGGDMRDAFTVVAPSLPGYGFSDPPDAPIGPRDIAPIWSTLMTEVLGCERYVAQGGDWGAIITSWLALDHPKNLAAIHLNMLGLRPFIGKDRRRSATRRRAGSSACRRGAAQITAYQQIQGTKPQTLAYGLTDLPAGLAAWILEKFHGWTIPDKERRRRSTRPAADQYDAVLDRRHQRRELDLCIDRRRHVGGTEGRGVCEGADRRDAVSERLVSPAPEAWIRRSLQSRAAKHQRSRRSFSRDGKRRFTQRRHARLLPRYR